MQCRPAEIRNQPNNNNKYLKTLKAADSGESAAFFFVYADLKAGAPAEAPTLVPSV